MASSNKKIIVVVGATGNQGFSVAKTFLGLPEWHVRCVTRTPSSSAAQGLSDLGAEIIQADLSDIDSLEVAFKSACAIFVNTDFWEFYRPLQAAPETAGETASKAAFDHEVLHGKNAAIAAAKVPSLERFVYSALPPMKRHSKGKYKKSYHADSKATIVEYIEQIPELAKKSSIVYLGAYTTNAMFTPRFDPASDKYQFVLPLKKDTRIPIIDARVSTGLFVRALIETEAPGVKLLAYDSMPSVGEITESWSQASRKETMFVEVSIEVMHQKFGVPMELLDSPGFIAEYGYTGGIEGVIEPPQLKHKVTTKSFEDWLKERDWAEVLSSGSM